VPTAKLWAERSSGNTRVAAADLAVNTPMHTCVAALRRGRECRVAIIRVASR